MIVKIQCKRNECSKVGGIQIEAGRNAFEGDWTWNVWGRHACWRVGPFVLGFNERLACKNMLEIGLVRPQLLHLHAAGVQFAHLHGTSIDYIGPLSLSIACVQRNIRVDTCTWPNQERVDGSSLEFVFRYSKDNEERKSQTRKRTLWDNLVSPLDRLHMVNQITPPTLYWFAGRFAKEDWRDSVKRYAMTVIGICAACAARAQTTYESFLDSWQQTSSRQSNFLIRPRSKDSTAFKPRLFSHSVYL